MVNYTRWMPRTFLLTVFLAGALLAPISIAAESSSRDSGLPPEIANASIHGTEYGPVTLQDGVWEGEPWVEDGAARPRVGLASNLKRVPALWIQRAELRMQFKRMEQAMESRMAPGEHLELMKKRVAEEYAAFKKALDEWTKVRDEWYANRKAHLLQKWEEVSFRSRLREIEHRLRMQRRRLRIMTRAYA